MGSLMNPFVICPLIEDVFWQIQRDTNRITSAVRNGEDHTKIFIDLR